MFTYTWGSRDLTQFLYFVEVYIWTSCQRSSLQSVKILSTESKELGVSIQFPYIGTYSVWAATEYVRYLQEGYDPETYSHVLVLSVMAVGGQAGILKNNVSLCVGSWRQLCVCAYLTQWRDLLFLHIHYSLLPETGQGTQWILDLTRCNISIFLLKWQWNLF